MSRLNRIRPALVALAFVTATCAVVANAQDAQTAVPHEAVHGYAGDIVEILAVEKGADLRYAWILTKDNAFLEAGRDRLFRTRFPDPGNYTLDAAVFVGDANVLARRVFDLVIDPRPVGMPVPMRTVAQITPPAVGQTVRASDAQQIVAIDPPTQGVSSFSVDLDTMTDTNGDGIPMNDNDTAGTLAATQGNALHLWVGDLSQPHNIALTTTNENGMSAITNLTITGGGVPTTALPSTPVQGGDMQNGIVARTLNDGSIKFSLMDESMIRGGMAFAHWDFGDHMQSLLTRPQHRYANEGTYTVHVDVIGLADGGTMSTQERQVTAEKPVYAPSSSSSSSEASSVSSSTTQPTDETPSRLWPTIRLILIILGIGILAVAAGAGATWLVRRFLGGSGGLQKRLEEVESRIVDTEEPTPASIIDVAPPTPMRRPTQTDTAPAEEPAPIERPEREDSFKSDNAVIDVEKAPSWLKKGLESHPAEPSPSPVEETVEPAVVTPEPEPMPEPVVAPAETPPPVVTEPIVEPVSPVIPEPTVIETPPVVAEPEPIVTPVPAEPAPVVTQPTPPAPSVAQTSAQPKTVSTQEQERLDRERERKRLKRQRYRQNKRAREEAEHQPMNQTPAAPAQPTEEQTNVVQEKQKRASMISRLQESTPKQPAAPAERQKPEPVLAKEPIPVPESTTPVPEDHPEETVDDTDVPFLGSAQPVTETAETTQEPGVQPSQPVTPAAPQPQEKKDDDVAFLIQADSVIPDDTQS